MKKILIIGSANVDYVTYMDELPKEGETLLGSDFSINAGGKGANQAVAAAKAGGDIKFFAKVGQDDNGKMLKKALRMNKVKTELLLDQESSTGTATVLVENKSAENRIVVVKGANDRLKIKDIEDNIHLLKKCNIIMVQLEIPLDVVNHVVRLGHLLHKTIILNPAPAQELDYDMLKYVNYITPNKTELETLTHMSINNKDELELAIEKLASYGVKNIVVTLGTKGAAVYSKKKLEYVPGFRVKAIDTTGAGDCFNGVFATCIADGYDILEATKIANKAASICVKRKGTIKAMPTKEEIFK